MLFAVLHAASRLALRLRCAVILMGVLVAAWLLVGLRLYFLPPDGGLAAEVCCLRAIGAGMNAILMGFLAVWVWRAAPWATRAAALLLVVNGLIIIQVEVTPGYRIVLLLTLAAAVFAGSLLVRPQVPPQF